VCVCVCVCVCVLLLLHMYLLSDCRENAAGALYIVSSES